MKKKESALLEYMFCFVLAMPALGLIESMPNRLLEIAAVAGIMLVFYRLGGTRTESDEDDHRTPEPPSKMPL